MATNSLQVPASYLAVFVNHLLPDSRQRDQILDEAGLSPEILYGASELVDLDTVLAAMRAIDRLVPPGWHVSPTLALEAPHHGPLGIAVVTAATVKQALNTLVRYEPTRAPWTVLTRRTSDNRVILDVLPCVPLAEPGALLMEINLIALTRLLSQAVLAGAGSLTATFPTRYRPWQATLVDQLPALARFEGSGHALSLETSALDNRCLMADEELHASAVERCTDLLRQPSAHGPLAAEIRRRLVAADGRSPGLEVMASQLNQSPRSLIRHLARHGTAYQQLVDEVRQSLAREWLRRGDQSIAVVAERLGYSDPANFGRAFRRWFGISPGQARRDHNF